MKKNFYANKPGKLEYKNMGHEFRPYVLFTNAENYRTSIVNTDRLGFRKTFFKNKLIGIDELSKHSTSQNIIIGGSTAFSMGSTSDKTTINSILNTSGNLWFSLGIRGAVGHQELITFLTFKRFFSKIKNIIIFSGLNDVIMCAEKHSMYYNDFGGILGSSVERFHAGYLQSSSFFESKLIKGRANLIHLVSYLSYKSNFFKFLLRNLFSKFKTSKLQKKTINFSSKFQLKIKPDNIKNLTQCSRLLDEILNRKPNKHLPYVGAAAFSHKGGLHVSAVQKDPKTYEHINPEEVGNSRNIVVSDQSGKSNIISRLKTIGIEIEESDPKIKKLLDEVKDREFIGYSYDGADASFELLARRIISKIPRYILIKEYDVSVKKDSSGAIISSAKAQLEVDGEKIMCTGEGNGPVNALDNAIRQNVDRLNKYSKYLKDLKLVDYKVRILNTGTEAITRVSIESTDSKGKNWFTIGVSANIIDASFKALVDSLDYKLFKDNAPASL